MLSNTEQQTTLWVKTLLDVTREGLSPFILGQYKQKYNNGYMAHMRADLESAQKRYNGDTYSSDDLLLGSVPVDGWLALMLRRWDVHFSKTWGRAGRRDVERLIDIRNREAHPQPLRPITAAEIRKAAEAAAHLLEHCGAQDNAELARQIRDAVDLAYPAAEVPENTPVVPMAVPEDADDEPDEPAWLGETERVEPFLTDDRLSIEVILRDARAHHQQVPVQADRIFVGRGMHNHIRLEDPRVSRVHLLLVRCENGLRLTDLRSANGTKLDGAPVAPNDPVMWAVGQVVEIGSVWLILRRGGG